MSGSLLLFPSSVVGESNNNVKCIDYALLRTREISQPRDVRSSLAPIVSLRQIELLLVVAGFEEEAEDNSQDYYCAAYDSGLI